MNELHCEYSQTQGCVENQMSYRLNKQMFTRNQLPPNTEGSNAQMQLFWAFMEFLEFKPAQSHSSSLSLLPPFLLKTNHHNNREKPAAAEQNAAWISLW